jgi:hypothetical protein
MSSALVEVAVLVVPHGGVADGLGDTLPDLRHLADLLHEGGVLRDRHVHLRVGALPHPVLGAEQGQAEMVLGRLLHVAAPDVVEVVRVELRGPELQLDVEVLLVLELDGDRVLGGLDHLGEARAAVAKEDLLLGRERAARDDQGEQQREADRRTRSHV